MRPELKVAICRLETETGSSASANLSAREARKSAVLRYNRMFG